MYDELLTGRDLELAGRTTYNPATRCTARANTSRRLKCTSRRSDTIRTIWTPSTISSSRWRTAWNRSRRRNSNNSNRISNNSKNNKVSSSKTSPQQQQGEQQQDQQQQQEGEPQPGEQDGEPQPGEDNEGEPQGEGEEASPTEPGASDPEADQDESDWPIIPPSGMTEDQAMQLLESIGENSLPLRNAIEQRRLYSVQPGGQNW